MTLSWGAHGSTIDVFYMRGGGYHLIKDQVLYTIEPLGASTIEETEKLVNHMMHMEDLRSNPLKGGEDDVILGSHQRLGACLRREG